MQRLICLIQMEGRREEEEGKGAAGEIWCQALARVPRLPVLSLPCLLCLCSTSRALEADRLGRAGLQL